MKPRRLKIENSAAPCIGEQPTRALGSGSLAGVKRPRRNGATPRWTQKSKSRRRQREGEGRGGEGEARQMQLSEVRKKAKGRKESERVGRTNSLAWVGETRSEIQSEPKLADL